MVTRRKLIVSGAAGLLAAAVPRAMSAADDPAGILTAIYTRVAKGKGDSGGTFVIENKAARSQIPVECAGRTLGQGGRPHAARATAGRSISIPSPIRRIPT